jgi:AmmeMemoRadiSam system protein A
MPKPDFALSAEHQQALLKLARKTLTECFAKHPDEVLKEFLNSYLERDNVLFESHPCFVTLMQKSGRLRGCIGCTETHHRLIDNVHLYTQLAAFEDPRFDPVEQAELDNLVVGISVLGPYKPLPNIKEVEIGTHGLIVKKGPFHGVLLAKVAEEYGWTAEEFLAQTYRKAGLSPETKNAEIYYFPEISFGERPAAQA